VVRSASLYDAAAAAYRPSPHQPGDLLQSMTCPHIVWCTSVHHHDLQSDHPQPSCSQKMVVIGQISVHQMSGGVLAKANTGPNYTMILVATAMRFLTAGGPRRWGGGGGCDIRPCWWQGAAGTLTIALVRRRGFRVFRMAPRDSRSLLVTIPSGNDRAGHQRRLSITAICWLADSHSWR